MKAPLILIRQLALQLEEDSENTAAERIRFTAERSLRLVEGLTKVSRLKDSFFDYEPINIGAFYEDVAHEMMPLAQALGQKIEVHTPKTPLVAVGSRELLRSVMIGLCDNALVHNDVRFPVALSAQRRGEMIVGKIRDHGPATKKLRYIRASVGRTLQPVESRPRSSGLGLLIAGQFAETMGASLSLHCHRKEEGVSLSLSLPASKQLSLLSL